MSKEEKEKILSNLFNCLLVHMVDLNDDLCKIRDIDKNLYEVMHLTVKNSFTDLKEKSEALWDSIKV